MNTNKSVEAPSSFDLVLAPDAEKLRQYAGAIKMLLTPIMATPRGRDELESIVLEVERLVSRIMGAADEMEGKE